MKNVLVLLLYVTVGILDPFTALAQTNYTKPTIGAASPSTEKIFISGPRVSASGVDLETRVPKFMRLVDSAIQQYHYGVNEIDLNYFILKGATPGIMDEVEQENTGWKDMAALRDGETLIHTIRALVALMTNPEYQNAPVGKKRNVQWAIVLHDLAKKPVDPKTGEKIRDAIHPFRSAVLAAEILPNHGFSVTDQYAQTISPWGKYTNEVIITGGKGRPIHDNRKLPGLIDGIDQMFARNSSASIIVTSILFHQSLNLLKQWPDAAPLTDQEMKQYIDHNLLSVLGPLVKADSDSWQLFNPKNRAKFNRQIGNRLKQIKTLINRKRNWVYTLDKLCFVKSVDLTTYFMFEFKNSSACFSPSSIKLPMNSESRSSFDV